METENTVKETMQTTPENKSLDNERDEASATSDELQKCEQEVAEWKDKFLRVSADFQNYKKRLEKEQTSMYRMAKADLLREVLDIVDNFDRALDVDVQEAKTQQAWLEGFELIRKELYKFLEKHNVTQIESYETFDPELHEAVMQVEADDHEPGSIVEVFQKGYMLYDSVLRPAKVSVAK